LKEPKNGYPIVFKSAVFATGDDYECIGKPITHGCLKYCSWVAVPPGTYLIRLLEQWGADFNIGCVGYIILDPTKPKNQLPISIHYLEFSKYITFTKPAIVFVWLGKAAVNAVKVFPPSSLPPVYSKPKEKPKEPVKKEPTKNTNPSTPSKPTEPVKKQEPVKKEPVEGSDIYKVLGLITIPAAIIILAIVGRRI